MAHDLATTKDGKATMFYTGEKPWHGLGVELDGPATAADAIQAAGLDYDIELEPVYTASGLEVPMTRATVRSDVGKVLGTVGRWWKPIQNRDCFGFLDGLVGGDGLRYHTAGALGQGERVWMLARLPGDIVIKGTDDVTEKYLLLSNSHDGRGSLRCFFTPVRVVCANTLNAASNKAGREGVTIRHTGDLGAKMQEARRILGLADRFYEDFAAKANRLAEVKLDVAAVKTYWEAVFPLPADVEKSKRAADNTRTIHAALDRLFTDGAGQDMPGVRRTAWAAYNAVTEFVDHKPNKEDEKRSIEDGRKSHLASNWFGAGADLKFRAWEAAVAMATA